MTADAGRGCTHRATQIPFLEFLIKMTALTTLCATRLTAVLRVRD